MLGLERQGLGEVALELGGALARDAVDEIERDVVEPGITKSVDGTPDVVRPATRSSTPSRSGWKLCAPSDTRLTRFRRKSRASSAVTVSGFASTVTSAASGSAASSRSSAAGSVNVGVPPPRKIVSSAAASAVALERELREQRVDVASVVARRPTAVTKSQ